MQAGVTVPSFRQLANELYCIGFTISGKVITTRDVGVGWSEPAFSSARW